jgi:hypothetical protein
VSEYVSLRNEGKLKRHALSPGSLDAESATDVNTNDVFERISVHEHPLLMDEASKDCMENVCKTSRGLADV